MRWKAECIILKSLNSKCYLLALLLSSWNDPAHCLKWDNHGLDIVTLPASDPSPDHTHPEYFLGKGSDQHRALCKWGSSLQALTYTLKSSSSRSAPNTLSICSWNHRYHRKAYAVINTCSEMFIELRLWRPFKGPKSLKVVHEENLGGGVFWGQMRRSWMQQKASGLCRPLPRSQPPPQGGQRTLHSQTQIGVGFPTSKLKRVSITYTCKNIPTRTWILPWLWESGCVGRQGSFPLVIFCIHEQTHKIGGKVSISSSKSSSLFPKGRRKKWKRLFTIL